MRIRRMVAAILVAAVLAMLFGMQGMGAASFSLEQNGSWQQMELSCKTQGQPDYEWRVQMQGPDGGWSDLTPGAEGAPVQEKTADGVLALVLKVPGSYRVSLVLDCTESEVCEVQLLDDSSLQSALTSARTIAANHGSRYDSAYMSQLKRTIAAAEALYIQTEGVTQTLMDKRTKELQALVGNPVLAKTSFSFLNQLLPGWWAFVDTVTAPLRRMQENPQWDSFLSLLAEGLRRILL